MKVGHFYAFWRPEWGQNFHDGFVSESSAGLCQRDEPARGIINSWLGCDREVRRKQRHTAKRVFERLRDEDEFTGGYTTVKDDMGQRERRGHEMFVPLGYAP